MNQTLMTVQKKNQNGKGFETTHLQCLLTSDIMNFLQTRLLHSKTEKNFHWRQFLSQSKLLLSPKDDLSFTLQCSVQFFLLGKKLSHNVKRQLLVPDAWAQLSNLHFGEAGPFAEGYRYINPGEDAAMYQSHQVGKSTYATYRKYHQSPKSLALAISEASVFIYFHELPILFLVHVLNIQVIHKIWEFKVTNTYQFSSIPKF